MDEREAIAHLKQGDVGGLALLVERYQVRADALSSYLQSNASRKPAQQNIDMAEQVQ